MNAPSGRGVAALSPLHVVRAFVQRIPLRRQSLPLVGMFACSYLLYGRIAQASSAVDWTAVGGLVSFLLLFVQLRFVDDLDDLTRDYPEGEPGAAERRARMRRRLVTTLGAITATLAALNLRRPHALAAAAAATALAYAAPFGFKRLFPRSLLLGSVVFEGAPALIFTYSYFWWRGASPGRALSALEVASVTSVFWVAYEIWKFSRKVNVNAMQPYFLSAVGVRRMLNLFFLLSIGFNLGLYRAAELSMAFAAYGIALPVVFLVWMNTTWPATGGEPSGRPPVWGGLTFVGALEVGLLIELVHTAVRSGETG